jgi:hypothetical protein
MVNNNSYASGQFPLVFIRLPRGREGKIALAPEFFSDPVLGCANYFIEGPPCRLRTLDFLDGTSQHDKLAALRPLVPFRAIDEKLKKWSLSSLYTSSESPARALVRRYAAPTMLMVAPAISKAVVEASGTGVASVAAFHSSKPPLPLPAK